MKTSHLLCLVLFISFAKAHAAPPSAPNYVFIRNGNEFNALVRVDDGKFSDYGIDDLTPAEAKEVARAENDDVALGLNGVPVYGYSQGSYGGDAAIIGVTPGDGGLGLPPTLRIDGHENIYSTKRLRSWIRPPAWKATSREREIARRLLSTLLRNEHIPAAAQKICLKQFNVIPLAVRAHTPEILLIVGGAENLPRDHSYRTPGRISPDR